MAELKDLKKGKKKRDATAAAAAGVVDRSREPANIEKAKAIAAEDVAREQFLSQFYNESAAKSLLAARGAADPMAQKYAMDAGMGSILEKQKTSQPKKLSGAEYVKQIGEAAANLGGGPEALKQAMEIAAERDRVSQYRPTTQDKIYSGTKQYLEYGDEGPGQPKTAPYFFNEAAIRPIGRMEGGQMKTSPGTLEGYSSARGISNVSLLGGNAVPPPVEEQQDVVGEAPPVIDPLKTQKEKSITGSSLLSGGASEAQADIAGGAGVTGQDTWRLSQDRRDQEQNSYGIKTTYPKGKPGSFKAWMQSIFDWGQKLDDRTTGSRMM